MCEGARGDSVQEKAFSPLDTKSDAALALLAAEGNSEAFDLLAQRMAPMMRAIALRYQRVPGLETEDLLQEGLLGLFGAVYAYRDESGSFSAFAGTCVRNRMVSLVRRLLPTGDAELSETGEVLSAIPDAGQADPISLVIAQEEAQRLVRGLREKLTTLEYRVLTAHLAGKRYKEIAQALAITEKAVDNALQRARQKLSKDCLSRQ